MRHPRGGARRRCALEPAAALALAAAAGALPPPAAGGGPGAAAPAWLHLGQVVRSNLGGAGPDFGRAPSLRYGNVAVVGGESVDLDISVQGDGSKYAAVSPERNGLQGHVGRVNVQAGTGVNLLFNFVAHDTSLPKKLDNFFVTVYDIDQPAAGGWREKVMVGNYERYCLPPRAEMDYAGTSSGGVHGVSLTSTAEEVPDPARPEAPGPVQENHAASFAFSGVSGFPVRLEVLGPSDPAVGRDFLFSLVPLSCFASDAGTGASTTRTVTASYTAATSTTVTSASTTTIGTTGEPFDCTSHYSSFDFMWFEAKRDWCCAHHGAGCPTTTSTTTSKTTTTATTTTQTSTTTTRTTSTSTGTRTTTTSTKTSSTTTTTTATSSTSTSSTSRTSTTRTTMTSAHYDCTLELNWEHGWSQAKKDWCCASIGSGCSSTATTTTTTTPAAPLPRAAAPQDTSADFDCTEGFLDAKEWPQEKRTWCCTTVGWGCEGDAPPSSTAASVQDDNSKYDCDVQYLTWDVDWSEGKKEWCCRVVGWGCQASRALVQKFERRAHGPGAGRLSGRPLLALAGACCLALALAAGVICAVRAARANDLAGRGSYVSVPARDDGMFAEHQAGLRRAAEFPWTMPLRWAPRGPLE